MMPSVAFSLLILAAGACMGSFGNVVVLRGGVGESVRGRSRCPACKRTLGAIDLVPVLSFVCLRARCRRCKAPISWQYPAVEALSAVLFLLAFWHTGFVPMASMMLATCFWLLLIAAVMDLRTGFIHDALSIPLLGAGIAYALLSGLSPWIPLCIMGGFFLAQWVVSRGRWVGSGDILLGAGIGAMLGRVDLAVLSLLLSYVIGATVVTVLLVFRSVTFKSHVPFGPFLAVAGITTLLWGDMLLALLLP